jgi:hypothetical protein
VGLPVDGSIRVPRLCGVRRHMGSPLLESRSQSGGVFNSNATKESSSLKLYL